MLVREEIKNRPLPVDWCQDPVNTLACQPRQSFDSVDFILFRKTLLIKNINDAQTQITLKRLIIKRLYHILNLLYEVASTTRILTLKNNLVLIILQQNMLLVKSCHEYYFITCILTLKTLRFKYTCSAVKHTFNEMPGTIEQF